MKIRITTIGKAFAGKCPVTGGTCLNPLCIFGCVERAFGHTK